MDDFIFIHRTHEFQQIDIPQNGITHEFVCKLADNLCDDNIVYINGQYYTHINLPDFLHNMAQNPNVNLDSLYTEFQEELWNCVWQQSQNVANYISKQKSLKSHETTSM